MRTEQGQVPIEDDLLDEEPKGELVHLAGHVLKSGQPRKGDLADRCVYVADVLMFSGTLQLAAHQASTWPLLWNLSTMYFICG